ncbi:MAG: endonuclease domain-containing protein [Planctomycetes bacterium]|nr:endonuclease domain-containing protein [Planctomycetota bacterium]
MKITYNSHLKKYAQELRKNSTLSEVLLWQHLKGKQMMGYDFHRQKPIDEYIVDFFCPKLNLIIEIDGETHNDKWNKDRKRQTRLESSGLRCLRFLDIDVKQNVEGILTTIREWIKITHP